MSEEEFEEMTKEEFATFCRLLVMNLEEAKEAATEEERIAKIEKIIKTIEG